MRCMKSFKAEHPLEDLCAFCRRKPYCKDSVMVKGINKLIKEVAPNLKLDCDKYNSSLSNDPDYLGPAALFVAKEVQC